MGLAIGCLLCVFSLSRIYSLNSVFLCGLQVGAAILIMQKFEIVKFLELVYKFKVTIAHFVCFVVFVIAKSPEVNKYDLSTIQVVMSGTIPIRKELEDAIRAKLPNAKLG